MELREPVKFLQGNPIEHDESVCPFCKEDEPDTENGKTIYHGDASDLSKKLGKAKAKNPLDTNRKNWALKFFGWMVHSVPNAHHLIPAEAAFHGDKAHDGSDWSGDILTEHIIMDYMSADANSSLVKSDIGYDVNESHNGIWVPSIPTELKEKKEEKKGTKDEYLKNLTKKQKLSVKSVEDTKKANTVKVTHHAPMIKWVNALEDTKKNIARTFMDNLSHETGKYGAQWHQTHGEYSEQVEKWLNEMARKIKLWSKKSKCPKCSTTEKEKKLPPPMGLLQRLKDLSKELRRYLRGPANEWAEPMFLSTISKNYNEDSNS